MLNSTPAFADKAFVFVTCEVVVHVYEENIIPLFWKEQIRWNVVRSYVLRSKTVIVLKLKLVVAIDLLSPESNGLCLAIISVDQLAAVSWCGSKAELEKDPLLVAITTWLIVTWATSLTGMTWCVPFLSTSFPHWTVISILHTLTRTTNDILVLLLFILLFHAHTHKSSCLSFMPKNASWISDGRGRYPTRCRRRNGWLTN